MPISPEQAAALLASIGGQPQQPEGLGLTGSIGEIAHQGAGGAVVDLPQAIGQAGRMVTSDGSDMRRRFVDMQLNAEERGKDYQPNPNANGLTRFLGAGARGVAMGAPLIPLSMVPGVGTGLAVAGGAGLFGLSGAQNKYDEIKANGGSDEDARKAAMLSGVLNAAAGGGVQAIGSKLLYPMGKQLLGTGAKTAEEAFAQATKNPSFLANLGKGVAGDTALMGAQGAGEQAISNNYGGNQGSILEAGLHGATTGAAMGIVGGSTLGVHSAMAEKAAARHIKGAIDAIQDPTTSQEAFDGTVQGLSSVLKAKGLGDDVIAQWKQAATQERTSAIEAANKPTDVLNPGANVKINPGAQMPIQEWLNKTLLAPGVSNDAKSFSAAADEVTGVHSSGDPKKLWVEEPENAFYAMQRQLGLLDEARSNEAKAADLKAQAKDLLGVQSKNAVEAIGKLNDALEAGHLTPDQHTELVNDLAQSKKFGPKAVNAAIAKYKPEPVKPENSAEAVPAQPTPTPIPTEAPNVGVATTPGPGTPGRSDAGVPDRSGSVAVPGSDAPPAVGLPTPTVGMEAPRGKAEVLPAAPAGGKPAAVKTAKALEPVTSLGQIDFSHLALQLHDDPRLHKAIRAYLGVDADGNRTTPIRSMQKAAEAGGLGANSHERVSKALKQLGLTAEVRNKFWATDHDASEAGHVDTEEPAGERVLSSDDAGAGGEEGGRSESWADNGYGVTRGGQAQGNVDASKRGLITAQPWYAPVLKKGIGNITMRELADVAVRSIRYDTPENKAALTSIMTEARKRALADGAEFNREFAYAEQRAEKETGARNEGEATVSEPRDADEGHLSDETDPTGEADRPGEGAGSSDGLARDVESAGQDGAVRGADEAGAQEDRGAAGADKPQPVVTVKKRRVIQRSDGASTGGSNVARVMTEISKLRLGLNPDKVKVVQSIDELPAHIQRSIAEEAPDGGAVQAFVVGDRAYLIAENIKPGEARAVFLHEVGAHMGLENLLTAKEFMRLSEKLTEWSDRNDDSQESKLARLAEQRVANARTTDDQLQSERIAYFIEEAVKAGIDPTALKYKGELARWMQQVVAALKNGLHKLGLIRAEGLTPQDIVDMAYGAAHLALKSDDRAADPGDPGEAPQFSKAAAGNKVGLDDSALDRLQAEASRLTPQPVKDRATRFGDMMDKLAPRLQTMSQLVERYKDRLPAIATLDKFNERRKAAIMTYEMRAHDLSADWAHLKDSEKAPLHRLMIDATRQGLHADDKANAGLFKRFKALTPKAQDIYKRVAAENARVLTDSRKAQADALRGTMADALKTVDPAKAEKVKARLEKRIAETETEKDEGPYFPLMRHGDYISIGDSKELTALRKQMAAGPPDAKLQAKITAMEADDKHHIVQAHENKAEQLKAVQNYRTRGMDGRHMLKDQYLGNMHGAGRKAMADLKDIVSTNFDGKTATAFNQIIDAYATKGLSENHALTRRLARKNRTGVAGADENMHKNFVTMIEKEARYQAGLAYNKDIDNTLQQLKDQAKALDNTESTNKYSHLHQALEQDISNARSRLQRMTPVEAALKSLTYTWEIGVQPVRMLTYMLQPHMLSVPVLAGEHGGYFKALGAMNKATADTFKLFKSAKSADGEWHGARGLDLDQALKTKTISTDEHDLLKSMQATDQLEQGMHTDLQAATKSHDGKLGHFIDTVHKVESWAMGHIDATTRTATALAAYRLGMEKFHDHEKAKQYAMDHTKYSQFEYGSDSSPLLFKPGAGVPLASLMFQFRRYQQGSLNMLYTQAEKAFKGDVGAMKTLGILMATHGLVAGALGMPLAQTVLGLINLAFKDDDPKGDATSRMRRAVYDMVGQEAGHAVMDGILAPFGANLTHALGMGNVLTDKHLMPSGFGRVYDEPVKDKVPAAAMALLGPSGGFLERLMGAEQFRRQGDYVRMAEEILPETLGDAIKAGRFASRGVQDSKGHVAIKPGDLSAGNIAYRALGGTTEKESLYNEEISTVANAEQSNKLRRNMLVDRFAEAKAHGKDVSGIVADVQKYNELHAGPGKMGRLTMGDLYKSVQRFRQDERFRQASGVGYNPRRDRQIADIAHTENE